MSLIFVEVVVGISVVILILLFSVQRFGTDKVGSAFAPAILTWFVFIGCIGIYNLAKHDTGVLRAFYPKYIIYGLSFTYGSEIKSLLSHFREPELSHTEEKHVKY